MNTDIYTEQLARLEHIRGLLAEVECAPNAADVSNLAPPERDSYPGLNIRALADHAAATHVCLLELIKTVRELCDSGGAADE